MTENIVSKIEELLKTFEEGLEKIVKREKDLAEYSIELKKQLDLIGKEMIKEVCELIDESLKVNEERKKRYEVVRRDKRGLKTIFGDIEYERTYYKDKEGKGYVYLVDIVLGIERYQRIDNAVKGAIIERVVDMSYEKAAKEVLGEDRISRQSVMNILKGIDSKELDEIQHSKSVRGEKKVVKELYIEADEDHISLQNGKKEIAKLAYINTGYKEEKGVVIRKELKDLHYFSSVKEDADDFWAKVGKYIEENFEVEKIENIYLLGDGANWIKKGLEWIDGAEFVLDKFHLTKEIMKIAGGDRKLFNEILKALREKDRERFEALVKEKMEEVKEDELAKRRIKKGRRYILSHWDNIVLEAANVNIKGCSAEGHVSHVLAERMSSRPRGWSEDIAETMVKLLSLKYNGFELMNVYLEKIKAKKAERQEVKEIAKGIIKNGKRVRKGTEKWNNIPVIANGKVNQLRRALKSLISCSFYNAGMF
ncbi:hypothetical protein Calkro_0180 [Caldicellulosiruptor kronotskyensis 2002]|uniref:ISLre2 family transposase n=1 Tax=Caldicellulosiruptor kronotskyensis (strain DSM 18902 / VKM B-2412 / 2002) TaxID=632348 RepID=E4SCW3_CALK2|nr:ISLre2-like element ISCbe4 family transposase [Caldicellulosiruptor kronotskyensis]ADQ45096.1 hypothetical protein Calkro_0180 [Caldicellulosiruptor kronotskyensis 2002]